MIERTPPILLTPSPIAIADEHSPKGDATTKAEAANAEPPTRPRLDPTRYGDWELNGKCVDF